MEERPLNSPEGVTLAVTNQTLEDLMRAPSDEDLYNQKAIAVQIASRSLSQTALNIPNLPKEIYAEWIPYTQVHMSEAQSMGFVFPPKELLKLSALHNDGTDKLIHGDVVLMVMPKWKKEMYDKELTDRVSRTHKLSTEMREEREFFKQSRKVNQEAGHDAVTTESYSNAKRTTVAKT